MRSTRRDHTQRREVVTLRDLAPRAHVMGGAGRRLFGAEPIDTWAAGTATDRCSHPLTSQETTMNKKIADLQPNPEQAADIKGGYEKKGTTTTYVKPTVKEPIVSEPTYIKPTVESPYTKP
jgi:hypothetical protein